MLTIKYKIALTLFVLFILFSCSSGKVVDGSKSSIPKNQVEERAMNRVVGTIMVGTRVEKIWMDESVIVGIVSENYVGLEDLTEVLKGLELEWYTPQIIGILPENHERYNPSYFKQLKRVDGKPISQDNSPELAQLRTLYWDNFGPGMFYESGQTWGVLSNVINVRFERAVDKKTIEKILKSTQAIKISQVVEEEYRVEYPKRWGYKILEVAKELFELEKVNYVENEYRVINQ